MGKEKTNTKNDTTKEETEQNTSAAINRQRTKQKSENSDSLGKIFPMMKEFEDFDPDVFKENS